MHDAGCISHGRYLVRLLLCQTPWLKKLCAVCFLIVQPAGAAQSLQCMLEVQVLMPKASRRGGSASSWVTVWQCQVLFTDDAARIRELQVRTGMAANF
jgi:hypothetical protein